MPKDPAAALALFESFIEADGTFFECADDSGGCVGDAVREACRHWLQAAARCETPASEWPGRLVRLISDDQYGAREELLRRAELLLDETALRSLAAQFPESRMASAPSFDLRHRRAALDQEPQNAQEWKSNVRPL